MDPLMDEMSLLDQQIGGGFMRSGRGEPHHRMEPENLDEVSLSVLGKKIPMKAAASLARQNLIKGVPGVRQPVRPQPAHNVLPLAMFEEEATYFEPQAQNAAAVKEVEQLKSKIEFLNQKLSLCESFLTDEQTKQYKIDWMMRVMEAAGDDLMAAAGKGFMSKKESTPNVQE